MRDRREHFRIHKVRRVYDRSTNKFTFNISYETAVQLTPRTIVVAEAFGLGVDDAQKFTVLDTGLKISPTDIGLECWVYAGNFHFEAAVGF